MKKSNKSIIAVIIIICLLSILLFNLTWKVETRWICATCGANRFQTKYKFWKESEYIVEDSALTGWLITNRGSHQHSWNFVSGTGFTLFGNPNSAASPAEAPAIIHLNKPALETYISKASQEDIAKLADTLASENQDNIEQLVKEIKNQN